MKYIKFLLFTLIFGFIVMIPKDTFALTVYAERFNDEQFFIMSNDQTYWRVLTSNFNGYWANAGSGYIRFQFSMQKAFGTSTTQVLNPMSVVVSNTLGNEFPCDIGTTSVNNSTYNNQIYSAICPVNFYNGSGMRNIVINFDTNTSTNDPSGYYVTLDGRISFEVPQFIQDNSQAIINSQSQILAEQQQTTQAIEDVDDTLKDNNISGAETDADSLVNNPVFQDSTGLNNIISLPLDFINTIGNTCTPITLNIPFINTNVTLPCFSSVLSSKVPTIYNLLVIVINGFILYRCCLDIYGIVKNAKNPNNDRIEVLDL